MVMAWKKRNWRTADKKPVKNIDLWQQLEALLPDIKLIGIGYAATVDIAKMK